VAINSKNNSIIIKSKEYIVDRFKFDNYLLDEAENEGAIVSLGNEFLGCKDGKIILSKGAIKSKAIIGCDGPLSRVNDSFGIIKSRKYFLGKQYVLKLKSDDDIYRTYFGEEFEDFFAWQVPVSKSISRVGIASMNHKSVNSKLNYFLRSKKINGKIIETNAGLIPLFNPIDKCYVHDKSMHAYLFGDASGLVKATTGGGIIPAFKAIDESFNDVINLKAPKVSSIKKELLLHLLVHNILEKYSDKDYDSLLSDCADKKIKGIIEGINRDNMSKMAVKLFFAKPSLIKHFKIR
jgi:flavin-dependent dehydrogenase